MGNTQRAKERLEKKPVSPKSRPKPVKPKPKKSVPYTNQHGSSKGSK